MLGSQDLTREVVAAGNEIISKPGSAGACSLQEGSVLVSVGLQKDGPHPAVVAQRSSEANS